jgi:hypothetical protein
MSKKESVLQAITQKLTEPYVVKISIYVVLALFLPSLFIGVIIAMIWGPQGYSIWTNYISDLGSFNYTPAPFILDFSAMITSILLIPILLFFNNLLKSTSEAIEGSLAVEKLRLIRLVGIFFLYIGLIGFFGIGLFSEDRSTSLGLHYFFSVVVFGGLTFGALFSGTYIFLTKTFFSRVLGLYMMIVPMLTAIFFLITPEPFTIYFLEWVMLFGIIAWLIPAIIKILRYIDHEI